MEFLTQAFLDPSIKGKKATVHSNFEGKNNANQGFRTTFTFSETEDPGSSQTSDD